MDGEDDKFFKQFSLNDKQELREAGDRFIAKRKLDFEFVANFEKKSLILK